MSNGKEIDRALDQVRKFIREDLRDVKQQTPETVGYHHQYSDLRDPSLGLLYLSAAQDERFEELVEMLFQATYPQYDRRSLGKLLTHAMLTAVDPEKKVLNKGFQKKLSEALQELKAELTAEPYNWEVYFIVKGIADTSLPFTVGDVEFHAVDERYISEHFGPKEGIKDWELRELRHLRDNTAAKLHASARSGEAARVQALTHLRLTLDVINYFSDFAVKIYNGAFVSLPGENTHAVQFSPVTRLESPRAASYESVHVGPFGSVDLNQYLTAQGFNEASHLLAKSLLNEVEQRIVSAMHWAGRATTDSALKRDYFKKLDSERHESFLFYAICLESIFVKKGETQGVTNRLSTRCAHLLGNDEKSKKAIKAEVARLYDKRSSIVHEGDRSVSDHELTHIRYFAKRSVLALLTTSDFQNMTSDAEYEAWFEAKNPIEDKGISARLGRYIVRLLRCLRTFDK